MILKITWPCRKPGRRGRRGRSQSSPPYPMSTFSTWLWLIGVNVVWFIVVHSQWRNWDKTLSVSAAVIPIKNRWWTNTIYYTLLHVICIDVNIITLLSRFCYTQSFRHYHVLLYGVFVSMNISLWGGRQNFCPPPLYHTINWLDQLILE